MASFASSSFVLYVLLVLLLGTASFPATFSFGVLNLKFFACVAAGLEGGIALGVGLVVVGMGREGAGAGESKKEKSAEAQGSMSVLSVVEVVRLDGAEKGGGNVGAIVVTGESTDV